MKKQKRKWVLLAILGIVGALIYVGVTQVAPYAIIMPMRVDPASHGDDFDHPYHPSQLGLVYDSLDLVVSDSIQLAGYWVKPLSDSSKGCVIFLHGISSCKEVFLEFASFLAEQDISSVLFDLRAHGKSGGKFNTFGYYEKQDVSAIAAWLREKDPDLPVGVWGNSLGGAIAYQSLAYDSTINFGVIQSTFAHLSQIVEDYGAGYTIVKIPGLASYALDKASRIASFPGKSISPSESCKEITQPVYAMHGDKDVNIDITYGKENFDNIPHDDKVWYVAEGADHYNLPSIAANHVNQVVIPWVIIQMEKAKGR